MQKELTTKQMEMLILFEAVNNHNTLDDTEKGLEYNIEYTIETGADIDKKIDAKKFIDSNIEGIDDTDFKILRAYDYINNDYEITIYGMQYIKLFNEDCRINGDKSTNFKFIDKVELDFSLLSINESSILSAISKLIPWISKCKK